MEGSFHSLSSGSADTAVSDSSIEPSVFQGSTNLETPTSVPPTTAPMTAKPAPNTDQAAQLRTLLASHLTGSGSAPGAGPDNRSLDELLDVLYSMTAPVVNATPEVAPIAALPVQSSVPEAIATVSDSESSVSADVIEASPAAVPAAPTPAIFYAPADPAFDAKSEKIYTFAMPIAANDEIAQNSFPQETDTQEIPIQETAIQETAMQETVTNDAPIFIAEEVDASLPSLPVSADAGVTAPMEVDSSIEDIHTEDTPVLVVETAESVVDVVDRDHDAMLEATAAEVQSLPPAIGIAEVMAEEVVEDDVAEVEAASGTSLVASEDSLPKNASPDVVVFSFVTEKSSTQLQIPVLPNLSLLVLEQRADETIIKIHLSV